jgi:two-component system, sensor histidine kinase and response regulator
MSEALEGAVLVVDDEPRNVTLLQDLLEARGYTVWTAANGEEGLAIVSERTPDVILLDVMMPRLNGFDLCRRIKADQRTAMIPVLLVTSLDAREDRLAGIGAGANDFITKPIDSGDLLLRVRNAVTTKRLYDQVLAQLRQLQELETARERLTHMIVHDLRSPLTGILGYLELIRMDAQAAGDKETLDNSEEARIIVWRLTELISQVLDVSRLETGHLPLSVAETDLVALLPKAISALGPPPNGVKVAYDLPEKPVMVACDRELISRVAMNLVGNAFKFTPRGGQVHIGLAAENGRARLTVTDNGPGVPPEFREMIFDKYGQAPQGRIIGVRSTGLGLAFCKLAVEAHGGAIGVEGPEGGGSRFWVDLPRNAAPPT